MKTWKGIWIICVAILHTLVAIANFGVEYQGMISRGIINSINSVESSLAAWFFLVGLMILAIGQIIFNLEKQNRVIPKQAVITLLLMNCLGAALMPVSGFWLLFPPLFVMLAANEKALN